MLKNYKLAHFSDTHLGREAYQARNAGGENQRAADFARAFVNVAKDIIANDPPLVIHSGDVADRPHIPIRFMVLIQHWFEKIAGIRPDGTRRQLIVVAGNHEQPRDRREACFLELFRGMPGVHIVTQGYKTIEFTGSGVTDNCDPKLLSTVVHCLPHDALKDTDFSLVEPWDGKVNIFSSHGVAGGSELFTRSLGKEFPIPTEVLMRKWDYGALGHWHKQGPINLVGATGLGKKNKEKFTVATDSNLEPDDKAEKGFIWYAGSTENNGFGDLRENGAKRGWLSVTIKPGEMPEIRRKNLPIRSMFRLPLIEAENKTPDQIVKELKSNLEKFDITGAIVGQVVEGVSREIWSLVDMSSVRTKAAKALHYDPDVRYLRSKSEEKTENRGLGDVAAVMEERANELFSKAEKEAALKLANKHLELALAATVSGDTKDEISLHEDKKEKASPQNQGSEK